MLCQFHVSGISLRRSNQRRPEKYHVSHGHPRSDPDLVRLFRIDIPPTVFGRLFLPHLRGHKPAPRFALCVQRDDTPVPPCSHTPEYPLPRSLSITPLLLQLMLSPTPHSPNFLTGPDWVTCDRPRGNALPPTITSSRARLFLIL